MTSLSEVHALLPAWVGWGALLSYLPFVALLSYGLSWLALRTALRPLMLAERAAAAANTTLHWSEHARLAWNARRCGSLLALVLAAVAGVVGGVLWRGPLSRLDGIQFGLAAAVVAYSTSKWAYRRKVMTALLPRVPGWRYRWAGVLSAVLILLPVLPITAVGALFAPDRLLSGHALIWLLLMLVALVAVQFGPGLQLARLLRLARPAPPWLTRMVDELVDEGEVAPRGVYVLRWPLANAFALPAARVLAFTDYALAGLERDEIRGVAAHELGHINEPKSVIAARAASSLMFVPIAAMSPVFNDLGYWGFIAVIVIVGLMVMAVRRLGKRMEAHADGHAHAHDEDGTAYARALEKIYALNVVPAVMKQPGIHGHLYDRLLAAGVEPDFERPEPPSATRGTLAAVAAAVTALVVLFMTQVVVMAFQDGNGDQQQHVKLAIGARHGAHALLQLAYNAEGRGDDVRAEQFYEAAAFINGDVMIEDEASEHAGDGYSDTATIKALAARGQCQEAARWLRMLRESPGPAFAHGVEGPARQREHADMLATAAAAVARCKPQ